MLVSKARSLGTGVVTKNTLPSVDYSNTCAVFVLREAYLRVSPGFLIGGQSHKHFLPVQPAMITENQTRRGKHMFILNHIVCKNGLGKLVQHGLLPWTFKTPLSVSNIEGTLQKLTS